MDTIQTSCTERLTYSVIEVAVASGVSLATINRKLASGELRSLKIGRRRLVPIAEVRRFCGIGDSANI